MNQACACLSSQALGGRGRSEFKIIPGYRVGKPRLHENLEDDLHILCGAPHSVREEPCEPGPSSDTALECTEETQGQAEDSQSVDSFLVHTSHMCMLTCSE